MTCDHPLVELTSPILLLISDLHLDICAPSFLIWFPSHPSLKDLTRASNVTKQFLQIDILVPDLIDPRKQRHRSIEKIARMLNVTSFQFLCSEHQDNRIQIRDTC